ncbi:hypothetical protein B9Z55_008856 [Caenorhabditis nigoni]|uniref:Uncharacterized protein n=1 Tax=Caenorhabditis nigoni TaxID=1611254 RepID=A0A2G5UPF3_9PELO|nr:hypothetical protein B9Z55_008856 [Caenorhabditis nigoni]
MEMLRIRKPDVMAVDPSIYFRYRYPDDAMIHTPPAERRAPQHHGVMRGRRRKQLCAVQRRIDGGYA